MALSKQARAFLDEPRFAILATINPDGSVQQTVMWYLLRDDHVLMNTARNRMKDRNILSDPRLSICVEDGYRFVTISGVSTLTADPIQAQADILALATRYNGPEAAVERVANSFSKQHRISIVLPLHHVIEKGFK